MTNEVEVYFALKGDDFDPDAFSEISGLTPTSVFKKGEPNITGRKFKFSSWKFSSGRIADDVLYICEITDQLIAQIEGGADHFVDAIKNFDLHAVLQVVLYVSVDENISTPALGFNQRTISFLHKVGAEIDVDMYRN